MLHKATQKLVNLRRSNMALSYGETEVIYNENGVLVIGRKYFGQTAVIVLNKGLNSDTINIELPQHMRLTSLQLNENEIRINQNQIAIQPGSAGYNVFYN
jgi:glycosidase